VPATSAASPLVIAATADLRQLCLAAATAVGFAHADAEDLTEALVGASLRSVPGQGQGVQSLAKYIDRVRSGVIDARAEIEEVAGAGAVRLLDAHRAHGAVAATRAMRRAVALAGEFGIGAVGVRDSTHLGAAGFYAELAAEHDCIGLVFTNAGPEIAPWGGTQAVVGTNPWAVATPTRQGWPVVLDMANSTSGKGMVRWHQILGQDIPDDWCLTADGERTTDPVAAMAGTLYPLGGAKGFAMALVVDLLTGALTGSAVGIDCFGPEHQDVGHLLIALRIESFVPLTLFLNRVEQLITQVRASPLAADATDHPAAPSGRIVIPGELEAERRAERERDGIPIPEDRYELLLELAHELDLDLGLIARLEGSR